MIIRTQNRTLHILQTLEKTDSSVTYVCSDMNETENRQYILNGLLNTEAYQIQIPLVMDLQQSSRFTDFADCFSSDGIFYLLFLYSDGSPFMDICESSRKQRLDAVKMLIEKMVLQDMPFFMQQEILAPEKICFAKEDVLGFRYMISGNLACTETDIHTIELSLLGIIKKVLHDEIEMRYCDELMTFCGNLSNGGVYADYTDIYAGFSSAYQAFEAEQKELVSKRYRFQLWETLKKHGKKIKRVLLLLIIAAVAVIAVYEILKALEPEAESEPIQQIGDLIIRENQPATEPDTSE
ncbi:MAG: hypothetical protein IJA12_06145 [Oscillospiraceae bacterium]|nr:hypothetical protein [Oscillospiraceae bacterium]